MLTSIDVAPEHTDLVSKVVAGVLSASPQLSPDDVMLVGARCRDLLHAAFGHTYALRFTADVDVALAMNDWRAFEDVANKYPRTGDSGICYRVDGITTDVMPFGAIEDPTGAVRPESRATPFSVWGFKEIHSRALDLILPSVGTIRIPTPAGYLALKLAAWMDRRARHEDKDARDIATVFHWYASSQELEDRIYDETQGFVPLLAEFEFDPDRVCAFHLGTEVADVVGPERLDELMFRWDDLQPQLLSQEMARIETSPWRPDRGKWLQLLEALEEGLRRSML